MGTDDRDVLIKAGGILTKITGIQAVPLVWLEAIESYHEKTYGLSRAKSETAQEWIDLAQKNDLTARMQPTGIQVWIHGEQVYG